MVLLLLLAGLVEAGLTRQPREDMADDLVEDLPDPENEGAVSYAGYQLLTVMPETKKQRKAVVKLAGKEGVHFWLAQKNVTGNFYAQILLAPNAISRVTRRLRDKGVNFRVAVPDLQVSV